MPFAAVHIPEPELADICRRHAVRALWLFGSAIGIPGDDRQFGATSDLDFLVEFQPLPEGRRADAYFRLRDALTDLFHRPIDLVTLESVTNPYFARSIHATKVPLYAAA